jgi:NAD/NADP transhydrogenase alpha subunit
MTLDLLASLYFFVLAACIGSEVSRRITPLLHAPRVPLTNELDVIAVCGAANPAGSLLYDASQLYTRNVANFPPYVFKGGSKELDLNDEIACDTRLTRNGELASQQVQEFYLRHSPRSK